MTKLYMNHEITSETQSAILAVFAKDFKDLLAEDSGNHIYTTKADDMVCNNVIDADDDPGEWAHGAATVIYHHGRMPSINRIDEWSKVSDMLPDFFYVEAINPEVSAVFQLQ